MAYFDEYNYYITKGLIFKIELEHHISPRLTPEKKGRDAQFSDA